MEESKKQFEMFKRWMDEGFMYPDSAYDSTGAKELYNQGVLFSVFASSESVSYTHLDVYKRQAHNQLRIFFNA